tara:strand:- start:613 stop:1155 length:543 start_codon:yes stop_codon:yes gene_type:complete
MKRNIILLISILISSIILTALSFRSESLSNKTKIDFNQKNRGIGDLFGVFGNQAMEKNGAWPRVENLRDLNLNTDDDPLTVFDNIDEILRNLDIKYENTKMPNSKPQQLGDFKFFEYYLTLTCSFEKFTQFIIELEKDDKIFIIHEIKFDNDDFSSKKQSSDKEFEIKVRSLNYEKKGKK